MTIDSLVMSDENPEAIRVGSILFSITRKINFSN